MEAKKLILVDDHVIVRNGLKELIEKLGPYKITSEFNSGEELLHSLPFSYNPDLLLLDLSMPGLSGLEVMEALNQKEFKTPVLILTLNSEENTIVRLFRLGVRGYLQKNCSADTLRSAFEEIFRCGYYHNEFLTLSLQSNGQAAVKSEQEKIMDQLTAREKTFLKLVCHEQEYTYQQIAGHMSVELRTVDGYRESIFDKFGIKSKTGLVLFILKHNLFSYL